MKKLKNPHSAKRQSGIAVITLVIFVVVLLSLLMAMVAMSRATSQSTTEQTVKMLASAVIDQGNMLKVGFDLKTSQGTLLDDVTFDATSPNGLFEPTKGSAVLQTPPGDAVSTPAAAWLYATGADGVILSGANASSALVLPQVRDSVCRQINTMLRNYSVSGGIPTFGVVSPVAAPNTMLNKGKIDLTSPNTAYDNVKWSDGSAVIAAGTANGFLGQSGCYATTDGTDHNVFINVVKQK